MFDISVLEWKFYVNFPLFCKGKKKGERVFLAIKGGKKNKFSSLEIETTAALLMAENSAHEEIINVLWY